VAALSSGGGGGEPTNTKTAAAAESSIRANRSTVRSSIHSDVEAYSDDEFEDEDVSF
jgi:hypothetical protein